MSEKDKKEKKQPLVPDGGLLDAGDGGAALHGRHRRMKWK